MASTRCHSSHGQRKLRFMSNRHRGCCFVHDHPLRSRRYRKESHGGLDDAELHHILRRLLPYSAVATPRLRVVLPAPCCEAAHPLLLFIASAHAARRFERLSELHAKKESARTAAAALRWSCERQEHPTDAVGAGPAAPGRARPPVTRARGTRTQSASRVQQAGSAQDRRANPIGYCSLPSAPPWRRSTSSTGRIGPSGAREPRKRWIEV